MLFSSHLNKNFLYTFIQDIHSQLKAKAALEELKVYLKIQERMIRLGRREENNLLNVTTPIHPLTAFVIDLYKIST